MRKADLIQAIEQAIGVLAPSYRRGASESDLYEASLLMLCVEAAVKAGGSEFITNDGHSAAPAFHFRRSPGNLWLGEFTYAYVEFPNPQKSLEIHLGVYVVGRSKVAHECDVAIIDHQEAERSRLGGVHPRQGKVIAAIEAKHYSNSPGLSVGRSFLGLTQELTADNCALVYPSKSSVSLGGLIAQKRSHAFEEVLPGRPAATLLSSHLETKIRKWLARL
ncbi:hypothetical protein [Nocardia wallacei]|uniref:hypothetical protein n=1 Tax=Nocardia wallacei TaxID=480035 RepID=UPI002456C92C|nr:hypothetical protein [Nocardia wallacei]